LRSSKVLVGLNNDASRVPPRPEDAIDHIDKTR
jgi:hypothetical protein